MSDDIVGLHRRALETAQGAIEGVGATQWSLGTPCDDWDVRELVNHIVSGNLWAAELAAGRSIEDVGDALDGDVLGDDPADAHARSAAAAHAAFAADGALDAPCAVSYGPIPGEVYAGHRFIDVLIHAWDVAAATGQDTALDPELVEACWEVVRPQLELFQGSGAFGTAVEAVPNSDRQSQLLAALGRRP